MVKLIVIDLTKLQTLDADPKAIKQNMQYRNLELSEDATVFFIIEESKETILYFPQGTVSLLLFYFALV